MNLIDRKFQELRAAGRTALIPFITVGDPDVSATVELLLGLQEAGADLIELGVPYSDPLADGPVIQRASLRALAGGVTIRDCIAVAKQAREAGVHLPFILFTYYNPVLQLGLEHVFDELVKHDISGVIIPDLPVEESAEARALAEARCIHIVPLVAPTSRERIAKIVKDASGFIYCVSSLGVTGVRSDFHGGIEDFLAAVRASTNLPIAIGFGISSREHVARFESSCAAVVVGSAIVRRIEDVLEQLRDPARRAEGVAAVREFVRELKG
ncbi:tryptophan synthase subunit alpha [Paenibacillus thermoaerophilus]|uniref:Tryptophan synthase alpha chain n=1 Tax=Paenibacillus thermoaerophilus TaxID=1215385 RepID=A0ABW2V2Y2_9BACL|nr:tryptophan synthase subunit alpha [Paenibacillus thermoaerophilus]TMV18697.1 tryptophan synthase subunit alpha [Paenibacillus thermoaerophilus]